MVESPTVLSQVVATLEAYVNELANEFEAPVPVSFKHHFVFRHPPQVRSDILASFLKCVRIVSLLNACLTLLKDGYTQEVYILCRSIEEATEDIYFFAAHDGESGTSENQKKALQTFYQEQFEDPYDPYSSIPRSYVRREDIRKTASKLHPSPTTRAELKKTASAIYSTFSGFVHGSYVFIMELYGGEKPHYHMLGMPNTPRISECEGQMVYSIYRAFMAAEAVALRTKNVGLAKKLNVSSKEFANRTGCLSRQHL